MSTLSTPSCDSLLLRARRRRSALSRQALAVDAAWALRRTDRSSLKLITLDGEKLVLGRTQGDVLVKDDTVSGTHCELRPARNHVLVRDLGSTNGTTVNGFAVGTAPKPLRVGEVLELGDATFVLELLEEEAEPEPAAPPKPPKPAARRAASGGLEVSDIKVGKRIGGGTFGTVFEGTWRGERVVLKQANVRVEGAVPLLETEATLNELAAARTASAVAEYVGALEVSAEEARPVYSGGLVQGLWLVWRWQGSNTLAFYLATRSRTAALAAALGLGEAPASGPALEAACARAVLRQTLRGLKALHEAGLVHCDVKPGNMLLTEGGELRLIDLGGAASCLNPPLLNYAPGSGVHDPLYSPPPPEVNLLAEDAKEPSLRNARGLWKEYAPALFDTYSAGIVLLQLCVPRLRSDSSLKTFRAELEACGGDVGAWRERRAAAADKAVLDLDDGEGWDLLESLLQPRLDKKGRPARPSAAEALAHPFLQEREDRERGPSPGEAAPPAGWDWGEALKEVMSKLPSSN